MTISYLPMNIQHNYINFWDSKSRPKLLNQKNIYLRHLSVLIIKYITLFIIVNIMQLIVENSIVLQGVERLTSDLFIPNLDFEFPQFSYITCLDSPTTTM